MVSSDWHLKRFNGGCSRDSELLIEEIALSHIELLRGAEHVRCQWNCGCRELDAGECWRKRRKAKKWREWKMCSTFAISF